MPLWKCINCQLFYSVFARHLFVRYSLAVRKMLSKWLFELNLDQHFWSYSTPLGSKLMTKLDNRVESTENLLEMMNSRCRVTFIVIYFFLFFRWRLRRWHLLSLIISISSSLPTLFIISPTIFQFGNPNFEILIYLSRWYLEANRLNHIPFTELNATISIWVCPFGCFGAHYIPSS